MANLTMNDLEKCFETATECNYNYIGVKIETQGSEAPEIIINPRENFKTKLDYYKKAYNNDLILKTFNGIKIIGFTCEDDFRDIEYELAD